MPTTHTDPETAVRTVLDDLVRGVRTKNIDLVSSAYASNALSFDMVKPLAHRGSEAREGNQAWFETWEGGLDYALDQLEVTTSTAGDLAFAHAFGHMVGTKKQDGEQVDLWFRWTANLSCIAGFWKIVHEHTSVPFDMKTGQAELALTPDGVK